MDETLVQRYPGLEQYATCQSRAFRKGTGIFVGVGAGFYFSLRLFQKLLPCPYQFGIILSLMICMPIAASVTQWECRKCVNVWLLQTHNIGSTAESFSPKDAKVTTYGDAME